MTREELIKACKYYKGENESPYSHDSSDYLFWCLERDFVNYSLKNNGFYERWSPKSIPQYIDEIIRHLEQKNATKYNHTQKSIIVYGIYMIEKWMPYSAYDDIAKY